MYRTDKSKLTLAIQKELSDHGSPSKTEVKLYDVFFLRHTMRNIAQKFGRIQILQIITTGEADKVFLVFDIYNENTIKDNQHATRNNDATDYNISGNISNSKVSIINFHT